LLVEIKTIAILSYEWEKSFSTMNNIVTWQRNILTLEHLSSLFFIKYVGPSVAKFNPTNHVQSWIISGKRTFKETCCPKTTTKDYNKHINTYFWNYLNKDVL